MPVLHPILHHQGVFELGTSKNEKARVELQLKIESQQQPVLIPWFGVLASIWGIIQALASLQSEQHIHGFLS
jgi:flagellar motor component MotA